MSDNFESKERGFGVPESETFKLLLAIPGVQGLHGHGYEVWISKAPSFSWDEVEPEIFAILNTLESTPII